MRRPVRDQRLLASVRTAVEVTGWLFLITVAIGGLKAKNADWSMFVSGGLWIGLPIAFAIRRFVSATGTQEGEKA